MVRGCLKAMTTRIGPPLRLVSPSLGLRHQKAPARLGISKALAVQEPQRSWPGCTTCPLVMPPLLATAYSRVDSETLAGSACETMHLVLVGNKTRSIVASPCLEIYNPSPHAPDQQHDKYPVADSISSMPHTAQSTPSPPSFAFGMLRFLH